MILLFTYLFPIFILFAIGSFFVLCGFAGAGTFDIWTERYARKDANSYSRNGYFEGKQSA
jgi:hypothetical protein